MLIESVPNVSEGRRLDVVDRMADAIEDGEGVFLLDRTSDGSHNRSVFTIAGEHEPVAAALERLVEVAVHEIDMDSHTGEHPRIGAVDVIPFVPLGTTTMDDCIELARDFGERIAGRFDLPVFLYANAATRPERVKLADVRRGQYEGLKDEIEEQDAPPTSVRLTFIHPPGPSRSGRGRSSSPTTSTSTRGTSSLPSGSPAAFANREAGSPRSRQAASGSRNWAARRSR